MLGGRQEAGVDPEEVIHFASTVISPGASWKGRMLRLLFIGTEWLTLTQKLKATIHIHHLTWFPWVRNLRTAQPGDSDFESLLRLQGAGETSAGTAVSSEGVAGAGGAASW